MKIKRVICVMLSIMMLLQMFPLFANAEELPATDTSIQNGCRTIDAQVPLYGSEKLLETAQAAMLYEIGSETVMYSWNPDEKLPPASLVKIMTCLLVLENCDITENVTVTESAMSTISETSATLELLPGEVFTVDQLLYGLMVGSANDAAVVLAEHIAGSQDAFVVMMNQRAEELGCNDTYYVNAHGLHDDRQYTTARDVARLVSAAMQSESFMEYFSRTSYELPATNQSESRKVSTTNYLTTIGTPLYYDAHVTGGRTGITHDAKRSIAVTANSGGMNYVAVVLSATPTHTDEGIVKRFGSYEEAKQLLAIGFESHSIYQVLYDGQILTQYSVSGGKNDVAIGPSSSVSVALPTGTKLEDLSVRYGVLNGSLEAPIQAGQQITSVEVWHGSVCVAYSPVVALNGSVVNSGTALQENRYGGGSKIWVIVLIVLLVAAVLFGASILVMRTVRGFRKVKIQMRYRRRRSERRRTK